MNGYICFYNEKKVEVHAKTSWEAQSIAAAVFRVNRKNQYKITVVLAEKNGEEVVHTAVD